jgi:hypothetical protein
MVANDTRTSKESIPEEDPGAEKARDAHDEVLAGALLVMKRGARPSRARCGGAADRR